MASSSFRRLTTWQCLLVLLVSAIYLISPAAAASKPRRIPATDEEGNRIYLDDNRQPALFTRDFGDCQGDSMINVTRFDAAYYKDNMTVLFHLAGNSALTNESLMLHMGVYAYGESRFNLVFNPCNANIWSLCPLNASKTIEASGIIPVSPSDVAGIPPIALAIPDFEGQAILRIFANSTRTQIGCYSAVVTNGSSFSHPAAIGSILGLFTLIAIISSIATAAYGDNISQTRNHYAHSLSVFVVFAVLHHIFFTGALSVNWPSVLVAFWSNYAWSAGMIYSSQMQNSINQFLGENRGNISMVGSAASGVANSDVGGGYEISQIYRRTISGPLDGLQATALNGLAKRELQNSSSGFSWYGDPVRPGLPLPGNYSGFAGTLAQERVAASNALMTALLWFLVALGCVVVGIALAKGVVESLFRFRILKTTRLAYFRAHWLNLLLMVALRTVFIGFFVFIFLTLFQFTLGGSAGVLAVAGVVLAIFLVGMLGSAAYALHDRLRGGKYAMETDKLNIEKKKGLGAIPTYGIVRDSTVNEKEETKTFTGSLPWWKIHFVRESADTRSVQDDEEYTRRFGWLSSRFRRSKWWFFAFWLVYEFVRACLYGGAAGHVLIQVFGLLVVEFIAFVAITFIKPFEGKRLNVLVVYALGFSKVTTVALSSAFDTRFNLQRIPTTVIGIVIIVIQGLLTLLLMVAIIAGAISSYMSLMRNRDPFKPKKWAGLRDRYFAHIEQTSTDQPPVPPPSPPPSSPSPTEPSAPYFKVGSVRRQPKIEDDDDDQVPDFTASKTSLTQGVLNNRQQSRAQSIRSQVSNSNIPHGARRHRASWSSRDFQQDPSTEERINATVRTRMSDVSLNDAAQSRGQTLKDWTPSRNVTPTFSSRANTPDALSAKHRHRNSVSSVGFDKIDEGDGDVSQQAREPASVDKLY